jgi:hypothetical protein
VANDFEIGFFVGLLVGEGHFGGDGRQPQVTLRMHVRHDAIFRWIEQTFPGGKLYGPYTHDDRHYYQWMARGDYLRDTLLPLLEARMTPALDAHSFQRLQDMRRRYARRLAIGLDDAGTADVAQSAMANTAIAVETAHEEDRPEQLRGSRTRPRPRSESGPESTGAVTPGSDPAAAIFRRLRGELA